MANNQGQRPGLRQVQGNRPGFTTRPGSGSTPPPPIPPTAQQAVPSGGIPPKAKRSFGVWPWFLAALAGFGVMSQMGGEKPAPKTKPVYTPNRDTAPLPSAPVQAPRAKKTVPATDTAPNVAAAPQEPAAVAETATPATPDDRRRAMQSIMS